MRKIPRRGKNQRGTGDYPLELVEDVIPHAEVEEILADLANDVVDNVEINGSHAGRHGSPLARADRCLRWSSGRTTRAEERPHGGDLSSGDPTPLRIS